MDPENIASMLKDAITASTAKIQSESKHTNFFVLPPELLEGILKNDTSRVNDATSVPSKSKETKTAKKNKSPSLGDSKSSTLPNDRSKKTSNRRRTTNKSPKCTKSQKSSKNNSTGLESEEQSTNNLTVLASEEQNHEQTTLLDHYEIPEAFTSTENIAVQNELNGGKNEIIADSELADLYNAETILDTILDTVQENIEISHEVEVCSESEVFDKILGNCSTEQNSIPISEKIKEECIESNHELQNCPDNETTNNVIEIDDITSVAGIKTLKDVDCKTEVNDHTLHNSGIEISKFDASQKISNKEISSEVELNNGGTEEITIIEEMYIVEEIIELVEEEEDDTYIENNEVNKLGVENIKVEEDSLHEIVDSPETINQPLIIKPTITSKKAPIVFKPIVEQKRPTTTKVYANKKKNKIQACINEIEDQTMLCDSHALREFQKEIHYETNYNFDCHSSSDAVVTETSVVNSYEDLEFSGLQEKSNLGLECSSDRNSLTEAALIEQQLHEIKDLQQAQMHFDLETSCWFDEDISYTKLLETYNEDSCVELRQKAETVSELENASNKNLYSNLVDEVLENAHDHIEVKEEIKSTEEDFCIEEKASKVIVELVENTQVHMETEEEIKSTQDFCTMLKKNEETISALEKTSNEEKASKVVVELVENTQIHMETKEGIKSTKDFCTMLKQNEETISGLEKTCNDEEAPNVVVELVENTQVHIKTEEETETTKEDFCTVLKKNEETISGLEKTCNDEEAPNVVVELVENTQVHMETEEEVESTKADFCTVLKQNEDSISGLEKTGNKRKSSEVVVELLENAQDQPETREEILSTNSFQKTNDTHENMDDQTEDMKVKVYNTRTRRKSANTTIDEKSSVKTVQTELKTNLESTENTRLDDSAKHSTESNVNNLTEDNTVNSSSKSETKISCKNHDLDKSRDNWENGDDIKSLRQLRNRTKVIPIHLINFNELKNNLAKESLNLKNVDESDVALKHNIKVSNRSRSTSLHFELNSPETLSTCAKKLSRKPMSLDNCLLNENRMSTLRRRSIVPENETKVEPILENSGSKETNKTADDEKRSTETEKPMGAESNLNEKSSCSTDDSQNSDPPMKIAINSRRSSLKPKKVIIVEKIEKERSSKSSQINVASFEDTENNDVQMDTAETDSNKDLLKNNEDGELNCNPDKPHCEMNISIGKLLENVFKVKTENVIHVKKFRRGRSAKFTSPDETNADNMGGIPDININQNIDQLHAKDDSINHRENVTATNSHKNKNANLLEDRYHETLESSSFDTSNRQVKNALKDNPIKIKTEKITPVKRGRRGRSHKSLQSNEIPTENTESAVDCHQSESESVSNGCEKLVATATLVDTSNAECQVDKALEEGTLKIKTKKITPVRRGRRGRSLKSMPPNEISTKNTESAFESHQSKNTTESIDCGELIATADPVNMSDAEFQVDDALRKDILKIKTEMVTPVKRGGQGRSSKFIKSNEITAENTESAVNSQQTENTELIDSKILVTIVNPVDTSNGECQVENAIEEGGLEIKAEKVTPARRGRRGRSSKSIPSNEIITENTENTVDRYQSESESAPIGCKELLATVNLVDRPTAECQKDNGMEENSLKIKTEKVTPIRRGSRGRRLQSIPSNEISAENLESTSDSHQSESAAESIDGGELIATVKPVDTSNVECHVDHALGESSKKIKTEKITPVKIGRRGRSSKSILSNQNARENAESDFDIPQSDSAAGSIDSGKLVGTASPIDTANVECRVDNALKGDILNIKTEMITPVSRGRRGRSFKFFASNEITKGSAVDSQQTENATESIDSETLTATVKPVDTSNAACQVDNDLEEEISEIQTEKVTPIRRGRKGRRSTPILSNIVKTEKTTDNVNINKNSGELDSADSLDHDEAPVNNCAITCDEKDENNPISLTDNLKQKLKCSSTDESMAALPEESALTESGLKIKTETLPPLKRGRKAWRSKAKPSINHKIEEHNEVNCVSTHELTEDCHTTDSAIADDVAASLKVEKNTEEERTSNDLNEKSENDRTELLDVHSETVCPENDALSQALKISSTKKGKRRRGRGSKSPQLKDTVEEKETLADDCVVPHIVNNAEIETDNVSKFEDASDYPESIDIHMEVDSTTEDNNITHGDNFDTIGINNQIKEEPEKSTSGSSRRSSRTNRHIKQEPTSFDTSDNETSSKTNIEETIPRSRRSSKINTQRNTIDDGEKAIEKNSNNLEVRNSRRSGRHLKSKVNYRAPDEDVDVFDSETQARQQSSESTPKKRRGRPSRAEMLKSVARAVEKVEESSQESTQNDTILNTSVDDSDIPLADRSSILTKRRRTGKRSAVNEDISEAGSKRSIEEKSLDTESDDTNDFDDNHFSGGLEDEEVIEDPIPSRGRKRKYTFKGYKARKKGRPKRGAKDEVENNDEDYTPHHSYVPHPPKVQETPKTIPGKKMVRCGKCDKEIAKHQWNSHNLSSHNDMGWISGTEKPDFENDQKLLFRVLTIAHKKKNKRGLVCETCREVKRSVVGFTSHIMFCGKTEAEMALLLVTCEICGSKLKPSSMEYHERTHRLEVVKKQKEQDKTETMIDIFEPRSKRKAAEKAVSKISEFTALVKDEDGFSSSKKMKMNSYHINKLIQKPQATKRISSITIAKWKKELENKQDAACTQLGCQFTCKSLEEMREHYSSCNFTATQNYVCKICNYQTASENEIIKHANEKHASEDLDINASVSGSEVSSDDDDYSDGDEDSSNQGQGGSGKKFIYKEASEVENKLFKFVFENTLCLSIQNKTPLSAFQWTLEFERKHFKFGLFENFLPNAFTLLEENIAKDYLPRLDSSMPVRFTKKDGVSNSSEWKNWDRFEACRVDDSPTFFVGGPVWAMAWAPTPTYLAISNDLPQFLAISTHPTMDSEYTVGKSYSGKNIIQIWNLGKLNNRTLSESDPELSYAITHDGGTVWSLEWCPSGCYQHEDFPILNGENNFNRLGLLAAGCSDGCVRIYSLTFPDDLHRPDKNQYPIYNTEIVAQLILNTEVHERKSESWQVFRMCWYREANHNVIVAGFSNGYVAFWDLTTKSPMLRYQVGITTFFRPYKQFFAHHHAVTMLKLVPGGNKRYLATASLDKLYKFWDLEDTARPKNTFKKSYVTNGSWFNNWCCAVIAHDEALCMGHNTTVCIALRDYTYKYYNLLPSNSTTFAIDTSDFANGIATGNVAGELLALFPQQLMYIREMERTLNSKRSFSVISTAELVDFKPVTDNNPPVKKDKKSKKNDPYKDPAYFQPSTYEESKDRFGIQFNNNMSVFQTNSKKTRKPQKKQSLTCEHLEKTPMEQHPLKSINKLAWNPNASSFLWLAAGYQNGFVRLISFRSAASTSEWNKLLQSHTNALKAQKAE